MPSSDAVKENSVGTEQNSILSVPGCKMRFQKEARPLLSNWYKKRKADHIQQNPSLLNLNIYKMFLSKLNKFKGNYTFFSLWNKKKKSKISHVKLQVMNLCYTERN